MRGVRLGFQRRPPGVQQRMIDCGNWVHNGCLGMQSDCSFKEFCFLQNAPVVGKALTRERKGVWRGFCFVLFFQASVGSFSILAKRGEGEVAARPDRGFIGQEREGERERVVVREMNNSGTWMVASNKAQEVRRSVLHVVRFFAFLSRRSHPSSGY